MPTTYSSSVLSFPVNPELTALTIAYQNAEEDLIADLVLPRTPPGGQKFRWTSYSKEQGYTVPNTLVGRKSEPNQVDFQGTAIEDVTLDYGLDDIVPNEDILAFQQMPKPASGGLMSPEQIAALFLTGLIQLDREVRVANTVFSATTYPTGNKTTLSGTSQWSDPTSDPITAIISALDLPLKRPNTLVLGQATFSALRKHPKIIQAVFRNYAGAGVVPGRAIADLFEVQNIYIGAGWINTARKGQAANFQRAWGKHAAALYISPQMAALGKPTFGFTHQFGTRIAGTLPEPKMGLRGSSRVRVGESVKEVISAPDVGYFWQNATA